MALATQVVAVPFAGGLETKSDEKVVLPTKLIELDNGEFTKQGTVRVRPGTFAFHDATVTGTTILGAATYTPVGTKLALATRGDELLLLTDQRIYSADATTKRWLDKRLYSPVTHTTEEIARVAAAQDEPSVAVAGDIRAVIWDDSRGGVRYSVYNHSTGAAYALDVEADANASRPWAVPVGNNILLLWASHTSDEINGLLIRSSNVLGSLAESPLQFVSDLDTSHRWAVCTDGVYVYIAYHSSAAIIAAGVGLTKMTVFGDTKWKTSVSVDAPTCMDVACNVTADTVNVTWSDTFAIKHRTYDSSGTATTTATTVSATADIVRVATGPHSSTAYGETFSHAWELAPSSDDLSVVHLADPLPSFTTLRHTHIVSSGFQLASGQTVFILGHQSRTGLQNAYYLYDDSCILHGQILYQTAAVRASIDHAIRVFGTTTGLGFARALDTINDAAVFSHNGVSMVTFDQTPTPTFADVGGTTYLSGSCLWAYDGQGVGEAQPLMYPDMATYDLSESTTGGSHLALTNQYSYRVYYEFTRANGERVRSAALTVSKTLSGANDTITLDIPTLSHTRWRDDITVDDPLSNVVITVFRSAGNDESGIYQKVSSDDPTATTGNNRFVYNVPSSDSVAFVDSMADSVRELKEVDYLSRGELEHVNPPGPALISAVGDRVFLAGGAITRGTVLYSKLRFPGEPAVFSDLLAVDDLPEAPGAITALSYINETLVVLRERGISALAGTGTDNTGASGSYESQSITTDVGCSGVAVVIPEGLMFSSAKGIYGLDQGFNVGYVGAPVERYNEQSYTGGCVIPGTNQVLFTASTGRTLMYDYFYKEWSAWTLLADSMVLWQGTVPAFLRPDGVVAYRDMSPYDEAVFTDDSSPYPFVSRTGPLRLSDSLQGFGRMRRFQVLGTFRSPHRLKVELYYDRDVAPYETITWDPATVIDQSVWGDDTTWGSGDFWGGSRDAATYQFEHKPQRQKFSTISFRFSMTPVGTPGAGYELTELALECGVKPKLQRQPATRKY